MDVVTVKANLIVGDRIVGHPAFKRLARLHVERREMPRTSSRARAMRTTGASWPGKIEAKSGRILSVSRLVRNKFRMVSRLLVIL